MSGKSHDLISTSLYYVSKHATRERIKSQLNCHVTFRRQLHHSILSSPYYQLLVIVMLKGGGGGGGGGLWQMNMTLIFEISIARAQKDINSMQVQ